MNRLVTISEAARQLGCSVEWLRTAEVQGKIPRAMRDVNGWRRYSPEDVEALGQILFPSGVSRQRPLVELQAVMEGN